MFFVKKVKGYICTREERDDDPNKICIEADEVKVIKNTLTFLVGDEYFKDVYFIPKLCQKDLKFLVSLVRVMPITADFKRGKLIGFPKTYFQKIKAWSILANEQIITEQLCRSEKYEDDKIIEYAEQARKAKEKAERQAQEKADAKAVKVAAREAAKEEAKAAKIAEREAAKAAKAKKK